MVTVTTYVASATAAVRRRVVCEKCGYRYAYDMIRKRTIGRLHGGTARQDAQKMLAESIKKGVEPVPFPDCGWLQANMVAEVSRRSTLRLIVG